MYVNGQFGLYSPAQQVFRTYIPSTVKRETKKNMVNCRKLNLNHCRATFYTNVIDREPIR